MFTEGSLGQVDVPPIDKVLKRSEFLAGFIQGVAEVLVISPAATTVEEHVDQSFWAKNFNPVARDFWAVIEREGIVVQSSDSDPKESEMRQMHLEFGNDGTQQS